MSLPKFVQSNLDASESARILMAQPSAYDIHDVRNLAWLQKLHAIKTSLRDSSYRIEAEGTAEISLRGEFTQLNMRLKNDTLEAISELIQASLEEDLKELEGRINDGRASVEAELVNDLMSECKEARDHARAVLGLCAQPLTPPAVAVNLASMSPHVAAAFTPNNNASALASDDNNLQDLPF